MEKEKAAQRKFRKIKGKKKGDNAKVKTRRQESREQLEKSAQRLETSPAPKHPGH